jgi:hypothetical protein
MTLPSLCIALALAAVIPQATPDRFWIAGRYDGDSVIVYFDAVKLAGTVPPAAVKIPSAVALGFFIPVALPQPYVAKFQNPPDGVPFKPGDEYDLIGGAGVVARATLTTLVGFESDEGVGNDSYIGALADVNPPETLIFGTEYFVVRPSASSERPRAAQTRAGLLPSPAPFDVESRIAALLTQRMRAQPDLQPGKELLAVTPAFVIQPFTLADGTLRYHVQAEWRADRERGYARLHTFAAWIEAQPTLRILAMERLTFGTDAVGEQKLLSVVDLGGNRTGLIIRGKGGESLTLSLVEYRDGVQLEQMRQLQTIAYGQ